MDHSGRIADEHLMGEMRQQYLKKEFARVIRQIEQDEIRNNDKSMLNTDNGKKILSIADKCRICIESLLLETEEIGGFCSFYPKECLKKLTALRKIIEMELDI